ncbi:MAG: hypothetical protein LC723_14540 [Actinobacteria bacterium]|nr:hypothetical protein [Actinomycetota bacterium]
MANVIQDALTMTTDSSGVTTFTAKVRLSTGSLAVAPLTIAIRDYSDNNYDTTGQNVTLTTTQQTFTFTKTLTAGNYYAWISYQYAGVWYNVFRQPLVVPSSGPGTRLGKSNLFYDDFATSINTAKWTINSTSSFPSNGPKNPGDHKVDYFHTGQVTASGGAIFKAQDAGFTINGFPQGGNKEAWYTGFLTSEYASSGQQVQTGDYLEGKFLLPGNGGIGTGAWPALWTWKNGGNEVDVFEYHPDNPNLLEFSNHVNEAGTYYTNTSTVYPGAWVTIGTLLGATSCDWYVNGTRVYQDGTGVGTGWSAYINLNLSLSDGYYHPQPSGNPFTFTAAYVGVWR